MGNEIDRSGFKELTVYKKAFLLAMEIFELTKQFPAEEKYSLTSQIRRSSRSVCSSIAEGFRKRRYAAHFISKATDADGKQRDQVWLDFAFSCGYIDSATKCRLIVATNKIGKLLNHMAMNPGNYYHPGK